jgi:acetyl-CoA acyltransferase
MDHIPMSKDYNPCPSLIARHGEAIMNMGLTAEYLAAKYRISRRRQDEFALRSHQLAAAATDAGLFHEEIVPTWGHDDSGLKMLLKSDQCIRRDTSLESLGALAPASNPAGGSVTAGNSSPINVGSAALLIMSEDKAKDLGLKPMARIRSMAVAGVDPSEMGIGPVPAVHKALKRAGLMLSDIETFEINEAFAVQVLSVLKLLGLPEEKVNTRGGALAIGHPLGASGARIVTTLLHRMRDDGARFGLATMCIGQGQGVATIFESMSDER